MNHGVVPLLVTFLVVLKGMSTLCVIKGADYGIFYNVRALKISDRGCLLFEH